MFYTSKSLTFRLRGIRHGVHPIECSIEPAELDIPDGISPIAITGELDAGESYIFHLKIYSKQRHVCDRCTEEFDAEYTVPLDVVFTPVEHGEGVEDTGYVHTFDPLDLYEVDLSDDVHDALLLAVPMKKLHSTDCKGIDIGRKEEGHVPDERFMSLGALYDKLRAEEQG